MFNLFRPKLPTVQGDLLAMFDAGEVNAIVHGCNCFCTMGGGIAAQIAQRYPAAEARDNDTVPGDSRKLGSIDIASVPEGIVINAYTQFHPGGDVNYEAIDSAFKSVRDVIKYNDIRLGVPAIGAGIAGGDWNIISKIIARRLRGQNYVYVEYQP